MLPKALEDLIQALGRLPGVGARTAERYALYFLRSSPQEAQRLADSLTNLIPGVGVCQKTFALVEPDQEFSPLYTDPERDRQVVAVVEDPLDVIALERAGGYNGTYHVLGGVLSPIDNIGPEQLNLKQLFSRISEDTVKEVIIATNPSVEGEATALYIQKHLPRENADVNVSRLARGLPAGSDLEYADQATLRRALEERQKL